MDRLLELKKNLETYKYYTNDEISWLREAVSILIDMELRRV